MGFRVEIVDPITGATTASRILQAAWTPPCLNYSAEYLAWQFTFPGELEPKVAAGFLDGRAIGCAAVTQRSFVYEGTHLDAYVLSFVAVEPAARGRGLGAAIYAGLLESIPSEVPVVAFTEPESAGERLLLNAFAAASFGHHRLQSCRAVGYLRRSTPTAPLPYSAALASDHQDFTSTIPFGENDIIWSHPTHRQFLHYASDPRGRRLIVLRDSEGERVGSAMVVATEIISSQGAQRVPMLESVCLSAESAGALLAAFNFAADHYGSATTVLASNLSFLDTPIIRTAGARALPSLFNAHVFFRAQQIQFANASCLNLEVI